MVINIVHTVIAIPTGLLSDRIGKEKVLLIGYGVFLVTVFLLFFSPKNLFYAFFVAVIFGIYVGIVETVQRPLIP